METKSEAHPTKPAKAAKGLDNEDRIKKASSDTKPAKDSKRAMAPNLNNRSVPFRKPNKESTR